jgi:hypothetical protein
MTSAADGPTMTKPLYETAITRRVKRLYHYQSYVEAYLESALRGTVRFSKPRDFNDPWDCKPWFNVPMDASGRERLIEWFDRTAHTRNPDMDAATRAQRTEELRRSPAMLSNLVQQASQGIEEEMKKRYRIYCLTTKSACPLMWAHYADKHRGICLEFDVWQPDLCSAIKVQYRETYPSFPLDNDDDISIFYAKSADWRYEDEYRLISEEAAFAFHSETLKTHDGFYTMPPGALKSLIVGALVPSETRSQIKGMVAQLAPDVIVREARCLSDQYQLEIERTIAD